MPEIYNRINPEDQNSVWNFSSFTPDVVVINLFQNDSWLVHRPERAEFKTNFGSEAPSDEYLVTAYQNFVRDIRKQYPTAKIVCMLGNMDITREGSKWPGYVDQAVFKLNDTSVYTHFIPFKNSPGHPSLQEQQQMAKSLISFIEQNIEW